MEQSASLGAVVIAAFVGSVFWWNRKWSNVVLDERELLLRLKVRDLISRVIELTLVVLIFFQLFVSPLDGLEVLIIIGLAGALSQAVGNYLVRR